MESEATWLAREPNLFASHGGDSCGNDPSVLDGFAPQRIGARAAAPFLGLGVAPGVSQTTTGSAGIALEVHEFAVAEDFDAVVARRAVEPSARVTCCGAREECSRLAELCGVEGVHRLAGGTLNNASSTCDEPIYEER
jgi:hypothetical protein